MICERKQCTGCFACYNICPKKAITMKEDIYGNIYPEIDKEKCVNCNLCKKICPQMNNISFNLPIKAYAMFNSDNLLRKESTSGGVATMLYMHFLKNNGVVYGTSNIGDNIPLSFVRIVNEEDLYRIKGSKYVHCYINDSYSKVEEDLKRGLKVLFIGTPCQIGGLKKYLRKEYDNLLLVDIVCHGVPSQKLLYEDLKMNGIQIKHDNYLKFRDEDGFRLKLFSKYNGKVLFQKKLEKDLYYKNFMLGNTHRECCYNCRYAKEERIGDITLGDFWGLSEKSILFNKKNGGVSMVLCNTNKGIEYLNKILDDSEYEERPIEEAVLGNAQLRRPTICSKYHLMYIKNYPRLGYKKCMNKIIPLNNKIKYYLKGNDYLYNLYNKIKRRKG